MCVEMQSLRSGAAFLLFLKRFYKLEKDSC